MSTYTLAGSGTQALSANVTAAHVTVNTPASSSGSGNANPAALYGVGLLRFGDGTGYWTPVEVNGGPQWIPVPAGSTSVAYNVFGATSLTFVEVIGGSPPFGTPSISLEQLTDALITSVANGDLLAWNSGAGKWENVSPGGSGAGIHAPKVQLLYEPSTDIISGVSVGTSAWVDLVANQSFSVDLASSIVVVTCGGMILTTGGGGAIPAARLVFDSAGTPINKVIAGSYHVAAQGSNLLAGTSPVVLTGLAAGTHTVKLQARSNANALTMDCKISTNPNEYSFRLAVIEHKTA